MEERLFLGPQEVADRLGCGLSFVFQLLREGELPRVKLGQRTKVPTAAVEAYAARCIAEAAERREIRLPARSRPAARRRPLTPTSREGW